MGLQMLSDMVWSFCHRGDCWPTPGEFDALCFAFTEAAEAIDAQLRQNGDFVRNHDKTVDVRRELTQCAMMLITALGEKHRYGQTEACADWNAPTVHECARRVAHAYCSYVEAPQATMWRLWAEAALLQISAYPGLDLGTAIDHELALIEVKHLGRRLRQSVGVCAQVAMRLAQAQIEHPGADKNQQTC